MPRASLATPLSEADYRALHLVAKGRYFDAPVISLIKLFAYGYASEKAMAYSITEMGMYRLTLGPLPTTVGVEAAAALYDMMRTPGPQAALGDRYNSLRRLRVDVELGDRCLTSDGGLFEPIPA
jgi:hypothetical protein